MSSIILSFRNKLAKERRYPLQSSSAWTSTRYQCSLAIDVIFEEMQSK